MRVVVHAPTRWVGNPIGEAATGAMAEGAAAQGWEVEVREQGEPEGLGDVGVIWGITSFRFQADTRWRTPLIRAYQAQSKPVIVLERGWVRREEYHAVGLGWIGGRADYRNENSPKDRWEALGVDLQPSQARGGVDLVCCQVPHDTSCQHVPHEQWVEAKVRELQAAGAQVVVRPHPKARHIAREVWTVEVSTLSLDEDLARARAVHTFNSTVGVDAMISGAPVFADDAGSMVNERRTRGGRRQWANDIAYSQWTLEEMRDGLPLRHLS